MAAAPFAGMMWAMARMTLRWLVPVVAALGVLAVDAGDAAAADPLADLTEDAAAAVAPAADLADPLAEVVTETTAPVVAATRPVTAPALAAAEPAVESAIAPMAPIVESLGPVTLPVEDAVTATLEPVVESVVRRLPPTRIDVVPLLPVPQAPDVPARHANPAGTSRADVPELAAAAQDPRSARSNGYAAFATPVTSSPGPFELVSRSGTATPGPDQLPVPSRTLPRFADVLEGAATAVPVGAVLGLAFAARMTSGLVAANDRHRRLSLAIAPPVPPG